MKIAAKKTAWRDAVHFGPFISWEGWDIWHHEFSIGFSFGPWDFELEIYLWDVLDSIEMLQSRKMTKDQAWEFCDAIRKSLPDPYDGRVNMKKKIENALAVEGG